MVFKVHPVGHSYFSFLGNFHVIFLNRAGSLAISFDRVMDVSPGGGDGRDISPLLFFGRGDG